jgi:hypothetical protein
MDLHAINFNEVAITARIYTKYGTEEKVEIIEMIVDLHLPDTSINYMRCDLHSDAVSTWFIHRRW